MTKSETHRLRRKWELPISFIEPIANHCRASGIAFGCTPFHLDAVEELVPYVDWFKISSYELVWPSLLKACAQTGKQVVLSTGMATVDEINAAIQLLSNEGCTTLTLLHCVSGYPTPLTDCNLAAIETLRQAAIAIDTRIAYKFGWSDHSVSPAVIYRAVHHWGAEMVEFHLDLDGNGTEFSMGHCWLPDTIQPIIQNCQNGFAADGNGDKKPMPCEQDERGWRADPSDGLRPNRVVRNTY